MSKIPLSGHALSKKFGQTQALRNVSFDLLPGAIHGLIGENGAGKSTLTKILCGVHSPDAGELWLFGELVDRWSPEIAIKSGIVTVHQDVNLIETMSVAENIFLNNEISGAIGLDSRRMDLEAEDVLRALHLDIRPQALVSSLPTDIRKMVQLARAIYQKPQVLLLDEPTSSLTAREVDVLLAQVRRIADSGVAVLYISHYLNEVFEHSDQLTVLRDGQTVWTGQTADIELPSAINHMIGTTLRASPAKRDLSSVVAKRLEVENLSMGEKLHDISFAIRSGEIFGVGGLVGAGLAELARAIFADPEEGLKGTIKLDGEACHWRDPSEAIRAGMALVTNDRHRSGAITDFSIRDNMILPSLPRYSQTAGILNAGKIENAVRSTMTLLGVKAAGPSSHLSTLSGGNQQKVMLAKWFLTQPKVLILDEPTIGVDIGAKLAIKELIRKKAEEGCAVLLLTTEMEEIVELADRAIVLFRGKIVRRFDEPGFTRSDLTNAANTVDQAVEAAI